MVQHRHIIILDVPGEGGCPGRGDLEAVCFGNSDATNEQLLTLRRPMKFPTDEAEDEGYLEFMVADGEWVRDEGIYGPNNPKEAFDRNTEMIEILEETIRFLKGERPDLLAKATAHAVGNAAGIKPKITDFTSDY